MVRILLIFLLILSVFFNFEVICFAQSNLDEPPTAETLNQYSEEEFQWALRSYVQRLLINFNIESINKERFLVSVMRLVNNEMNNRITNKRAAVERYFNGIKNQLNELQILKSRFKFGKFFVKEKWNGEEQTLTDWGRFDDGAKGVVGLYRIWSNSSIFSNSIYKDFCTVISYDLHTGLILRIIDIYKFIW